MHVLGIVGSARKGPETETTVRHVLNGIADEVGVKSPVAGKPCGLVAVAEYSNPHHLLEYLVDFCSLLGMNPVRVQRFPYLGVGVHGAAEDDGVFPPLERAKDLPQEVVRTIEGASP